MTDFCARDRCFGGCQFCDLCIIIGTIGAEEPTSRRNYAKLEFDTLAGRSTDVGGKLNGIADPVGLDLNVAPIDVIGCQICSYSPVKPDCLGADLVAFQIVRRGAERNDNVVLAARSHAGPTCGGIDDRCAKASGECGVGGNILRGFERSSKLVGWLGSFRFDTFHRFIGRKRIEVQRDAKQGGGIIIGLNAGNERRGACSEEAPRFGKALSTDLSVPEAACQPEAVGEAISKLAKRRNFFAYGVGILFLEILVRKTGKSTCLEKSGVGAIEKVNVPATVEVEAAYDEFERTTERGGKPGFLYEHVIERIGVEAEGDRGARKGAGGEGSSQIDIETLLEVRIG